MSFRRISILSAFSIFFLYGGLILSLLYFSRLSLIPSTLFSDRVLFSIRLSLFTATIAALLSVGGGIPAAYALSRFDFPGKKTIDTLLELPIVVSPAAFGAMILIFFNNPLGIWIQEKWYRFVFEVQGIILAQMITSIGISTRLIKAAMDEISHRYEEVARSLGASHAKAFFTITLPLLKKGILAALILTWAKALGEFGATITIAGSMPFKTETLPIAIFMRLSTADIEGTVVLILILILLGLGILYGLRVFLRT